MKDENHLEMRASQFLRAAKGKCREFTLSEHDSKQDGKVTEDYYVITERKTRIKWEVYLTRLTHKPLLNGKRSVLLTRKNLK